MLLRTVAKIVAAAYHPCEVRLVWALAVVERGWCRMVSSIHVAQ